MGVDISAVLAANAMITTLVDAKHPLTDKKKSTRLEKYSDFKLEGNMRGCIGETFYNELPN